uniref:Putative phosphoglycerate mutase GpmB n=1 Tax=Anthurium amnicola TaxID=1678845 RepID=A0A1D1ZAW4_9ARAE
MQEVGFSEEQIQSSDSLIEMSQGQWEGCHRSEVYTPEMVSLIDRIQPDFCAPSGESLRQVEFRMMEFLNRTILRIPDKLFSGDFLMHLNESKGFSRQISTNSVQDRDGPIIPHWDLLHRNNRQSISRKRSGKSRLQFVTTGDNETEEEFSPGDTNHGHLLHEVTPRNPACTIAIFTHATPIKCLMTGLLNCSPVMSHRMCIDDSSMTVLWYSQRSGWQIKRLNDTAHLRLL